MATDTLSRKYFPSVDGLRAIAVLLVVLYHFDIKFLSGGFVGVDVFFVISGFLITRNIRNSVNTNSFSFWSFYRARLRRLYPALLVTIGVTLALSPLLLSPEHLRANSFAAISSTLSVANLYFWNEAGYFDTEAIFKPLLHFWSLSVEEQYYLFWPATLIVILKFIPQRALQVLLISTLIIISAYTTEETLLTQPDKAFYWFHLRIYEFLIGAILVWITDHANNKSTPIHSVLTLGGIFLIVYSGMTYNHSTAFPGFNALIPCIGGGLIILSKNSVASDVLLANILMRWLGKISYSIYLVHWPVWVFYSYWKFDTISSFEKVFLALATLLLACGLHYFVEVKFRYSISPSNKKFYISILASVSLIILASILISHLKSSKPVTNIKLDCHVVENTNPKIKEKKCFQESTAQEASKRILVIGDSHAGHLQRGLSKFSAKHNFDLEIWTFSGCPPIWNTYKIYGVFSDRLDYKEDHCRLLIPKWKEYLTINKYDLVILASRWALLTEPTKYTESRKFRRDYLVDVENPKFTLEASRDTFRNKLAFTIDDILEQQPRKILLIGQIPVLGRSIQGCSRAPKLLAQEGQIAERCSPKVSYQKMIDRLQFSNDVLKSLESKHVLPLLPSDVLCSNQQQECKTVIGNDSIYQDDNHFNNIGSEHFISTVENQILELLKR